MQEAADNEIDKLIKEGHIEKVEEVGEEIFESHP